MPETGTQRGKSFDQNINILIDELLLATQWGRPSLLLAIHKSRFGQDKAEKVLESKLAKHELKVVRIVVNDQRTNVADLIRAKAREQQTVFFVSNIDWGGGEDGKQAYRALNMQRELFVEERIKAVFWLTVSEAANLPRHAPDFWAFRHRVVEFASQRAPAKISLPAGVLLWDIQKSVDPFESLQDGIRARADLLGKLPNNMEALSTKVELYFSLGHLHWVIGEIENAARSFRGGLELATEHELPELKARLLNGMGIVHYELEAYSDALENFKAGVLKGPPSSSRLINLAAACCMMGRNQEATAHVKKAIRLNPTSAEYWNRIGYIFAAMGKPDEAISWFTKAVELAPRISEYHQSLAVLYGAIDRADEARRHLGIARELVVSDSTIHLDIIEQAVLGDPAQARKMLQAASASNQISKHDLHRDPDFGILFVPLEIQVMPG